MSNTELLTKEQKDYFKKVTRDIVLDLRAEPNSAILNWDKFHIDGRIVGEATSDIVASAYLLFDPHFVSKMDATEKFKLKHVCTDLAAKYGLSIPNYATYILVVLRSYLDKGEVGISEGESAIEIRISFKSLI